jgi:stage II sporulation protein D
MPGFHHRHCGGRTATPREVWAGESDHGLLSIEDPYCLSSAGGTWRAQLELPERDLRIWERTASGRVKTLRDGTRRIDAEAFHLYVGRSFGWTLLRSRLYDLRREGSHYAVEGHGHGHGVGLCQEGAASRARAGHGVEEIAKAYFGAVRVGVTASHRRWKQVRTARLEVRHAGANMDDLLPARAEQALGEAERLSGLRLNRRFRVTAFPTVDLYRELTGAGGFVAATTRGGEVRLQPVAVLERQKILGATLRHEFLHGLIGSHAQRALPEWFCEGLALWLERPDGAAGVLAPGTEKALSGAADQEALRRAYENARAAVAGLVLRHGRARVLDSLRLGLPE